MHRRLQQTRRQTLELAGAVLAGSTALAGCAGSTPEETSTATTTEPPTSTAATSATETAGEVDIRLGGEVAGWVGQEPTRIEGQTNPTLALTPGTTYTVVWENLDGVIHNFVVLDANGDPLVESEDSETVGTTRQVTFEATAAMTQYYCVYHPTTMYGSITTDEETATAGGSGGTTAANGSTTGDETTTSGGGY